MTLRSGYPVLALSLSTFLTTSLGCAGEPLVDGLFTAGEWSKIQKLSPLPDPEPDTTNRYESDPAAAAFGQRLFFELDYAGPLRVGDNGSNGGLGAVGETKKIACASCHEGPWLIDLRSKPGHVSLGADIIPRNSATMVNVAYYNPWIENDGLLDSLWSESMVDIEFDPGFNSSRLRLAHVIYDKHRAEYNRVFDPDLDPALDPTHPMATRFPADGRPGSAAWNGMTTADQDHVTQIYVNFGKALHAHLRRLISKNAPFDRYVAGDYSALSQSAKNGLKLFVGKAGCDQCHKSPHFSDDDFHNTGLAAFGAGINTMEKGRYDRVDFLRNYEFNSNSRWSDDRNTGRLDKLVKDPSLIGAWRTKGLRQIAETGPFMHTGQFRTLEECIDFYNNGGHANGFQGVKDKLMKPLNLTSTEQADLVSFLKSLTGQQVPAAILQKPAN